MGQPLKMIYPVKESHLFQPSDFVAGHAAIDFVNTVTGRNGTPRDWLLDATALASWAFKSGTITDSQAVQLKSLIVEEPAAGNAVLAKALEVREAMFRLLDAIVDDKAIPKDCMAMIEDVWRRAASVSDVRWDDAHGLCVNQCQIGTSMVVDRIVFQFVALGPILSSPRLRRCAGNNCGWFFIDTSKAGRRRWCDMATCGNAAKYERFRA